MKNKRVYVLCGVLVFVLLTMILAPFIKSQVFSYAPITNEMTLEDLQKQKIQVTYVETIEGWSEKDITQFGKEQLKKSKKCKNVFIVKPTGNIYFNQGLILQEVRINKVIKGKETADTIWVRNGLHSTLHYKKKKDEVELSGMNRSFMQTDCEYLLFCKPSETNIYSTHKIYTEAGNMWFGCYNLTKSSDQVVPAKNAYYDSSIEFYADSEKLLLAFQDAKERLTKYYIAEK